MRSSIACNVFNSSNNCPLLASIGLRSWRLLDPIVSHPVYYFINTLHVRVLGQKSKVLTKNTTIIRTACCSIQGSDKWGYDNIYIFQFNKIVKQRLMHLQRENSHPMLFIVGFQHTLSTRNEFDTMYVFCTFKFCWDLSICFRDSFCDKQTYFRVYNISMIWLCVIELVQGSYNKMNHILLRNSFHRNWHRKIHSYFAINNFVLQGT